MSTAWPNACDGNTERAWRKSSIIHKQIKTTKTSVKMQQHYQSEQSLTIILTSFRIMPPISKKLWNSLKDVLHRKEESVLPDDNETTSLADRFGIFFRDKIARIRSSFSSVCSCLSSPDSPPPCFPAFASVSQDDILKFINKSPTKSCTLDPWPTFLVKECLDILLPSITKLVNLSLSSGVVPATFKRAVVTPLIKKSSLPRNEFKNYRPVSGLCFISKLVERVVAAQISDHIDANNLNNDYQSAYKRGHSTETALLCIKNDVHMAMSQGVPTALVLLDLSAAFDTIDHGILIKCLTDWFGLKDTALAWFQSYLRDRFQSIKVGHSLSKLFSLDFGVPQGSVLGPILFSLYTTPLSQVISSFKNIKYHFYADDTQVYIRLTPKDTATAFDNLGSCLQKVQSWMDGHKLKLNPDKTEFIVFGSKTQRSALSDSVSCQHLG